MGLEVLIETDDASDFGDADIKDVGDDWQVFRVDISISAHQLMESVDGPAKLVLMGSYLRSNIVFGHRNKIFFRPATITKSIG